MGTFRCIWASTFSLFWPALVVVVPLGITFHAARVYAESGPATPACGSAEFTPCADAGAMTACKCTGECACVSKPCLEGGTTVTALACTSIFTCSAHHAVPCEGKTAGTSCMQIDSTGAPILPGTCGVLTNGCFEKGDAGLYEKTHPLVCSSGGGRKDGGATGTDGGATGTDGGVADAGTSAPGENESSGCSAAPPGAAASGRFLAALGLALLLVARSRGRRRPALTVT